ncbi:phosphopantetheine-binding protein [Roseomonas sp. GC11]|uniref:phosphopantetheine-binding protein n=1 Tax=Roseomonas sp. GC11 TaxID=2950546 RepID=UPI00210CC41B|nr:phosphopantetheine-binding protein [Roseomonas sp. GC11]MCQ4158682.1 phosphopantetheine-binding protein [Roseomonas sp. GC11]
MSPTTKTCPATREEMRAALARLLRMEAEEIGDDDNLADLGLDSLRAMNLMLSWSEGGLELDFAELAENLTLSAWWGVAEKALAKRAHG